MFGINVADAVLVGTLIVAVVAMLRGGQQGDQAKKTNPPDPAIAVLGATLVDTAVFRGLVDVLQEINATMCRGIEERREETQDRMTELLEEISVKLDGQAPRRRPRARKSRTGGRVAE